MIDIRGNGRLFMKGEGLGLFRVNWAKLKEVSFGRCGRT